jgi:hypothetical protein
MAAAFSLVAVPSLVRPLAVNAWEFAREAGAR